MNTASARSSRLPPGASLVAVIVAAAVLAGAALDLDVLDGIAPGLPGIKLNTALSLILIGTALWVLRDEGATRVARRVGQAASVSALLLEIATLAGSVLGQDLRIDQFLVLDPAAAVPALPAGGPGASTLTLVLLAISLLLIDVQTRAGARPAEWIALAALTLPLVTFTAYLYDTQAVQRMPAFSTMALPTALVCLLLAAGVLWARPGHGLMAVITGESAGGVMARRLLPAAVIIPPVLGWLRVQGEMAGWYRSTFGAALVASGAIVLFCGVIWINARTLQRFDYQRRAALERLRRAGETLEERVAVRTEELRTANEALRTEVEARTRAEGQIRDLNTALSARAAELEVVNEELGAFSYSVSHDLRAPLRAIDGFSQALLEDCADRLDDAGRDHLGRVRAAAQRMGQLIDDLLKLSRVTRADLALERLDLSALASAAAGQLRDAEPHRQVEIRITSNLTVDADRQLMRVALENLLGNAWKFTGKRGAARIEVGVLDDDGRRVYFVRDNGAGFDMTYTQKLFGAFQRLHGAGEFPGTGIGLATVQRIIHKHGGRIWAEAQVDQGATLYFTLGPEGR